MKNFYAEFMGKVPRKIEYFSVMDLEQQKYPIGKLNVPETITEAVISEALTVLQLFPEQLKLTTYSLKDAQLDLPYRDGEGVWTIRQLIHHIADSHHHAYNRIRWTLSEENPTAKVYDQDAFAKSYDYKHAPIAWSVSHIEVLHQKMVYILSNLSEAQWERTYVHPADDKVWTLKEVALQYAWHSMHHFAHIKNGVARG